MPNYTLPPLPPSDDGALSRNHFDSYYRTRSRDFWGDAEITRIELKPDKKCEHEFKAIPTGAQCSKCSFGLIGPIEVREGKLFHKGEQLPL